MANQIETIINVQLENRDKKTVFWRGILVAPMIAFVAAFTPMADNGWATGMIVIPAGLAILFRGLYPSYVLSFNHALIELETRVFAYLFLLTDEYPSIERNPNVAVLLPDVDGGRKLNRGLPLVKWFLAIPLVVVGLIYIAYALLLTLWGWFSILFTGTYPEKCAEGVVGTIAYWNRVVGYALVLVTDEYPTFSL